MPSFLYILLRWCPGILGILLRQKLYHRLLRACGRNVLIGRYVDLKNPGAIVLGEGVILNDYACLDASQYVGSDAAITLGDKVFLGASSILTAGAGRLVIGEKTNIGSGCSLWARHHDLRIDDHALLAGFCTVGQEAVIANEYDPNETPLALAPSSKGGTHLGSGCWLGLRSQVLSGLEIGEGTIVGAHSVVADSLPPYVIAFGQPASVKRDRP